jgi:hypothetical protein
MLLPPAVDAFLRDNLTLVLALVSILTLLLILLVVALVMRLSRLMRLYRRLTQGTSGGNLEEKLVDYSDQVTEVDRRMQELEATAARLAQNQRKCIQKIGMVRYDAFEDVGGEQSFSMALTDADQNGAVISSVYSRTDIRVYAKSLENGRASRPLSAEEQKALSEGHARTQELSRGS